MIFTDWVVAWDSVTKRWHKVHVIVDTEAIANTYLRKALKLRRNTHTVGGITIEVSKGVLI